MAHANEPYTWHHVLYVGDTYAPGTFRLRQPDRTPYALTGATGTVQVRHAKTDEVLIEGAIVVTDGPNGEFTWEVSASQTGEIPAGRHPYAVRLTLPDETVRTVLVGEVTVKQGVS